MKFKHATPLLVIRIVQGGNDCLLLSVVALICYDSFNSFSVRKTIALEDLYFHHGMSFVNV